MLSKRIKKKLYRRWLSSEMIAMTNNPSWLGHFLNEYMHDCLDDVLNSCIVESRLKIKIEIRDKNGL